MTHFIPLEEVAGLAAVMRRKNDSALKTLTGVLFGATTAAGLMGLHFQPSWGALLLGLIAGACTIASAELGTVVAVISLSLAITAANPAAGIICLVIGLASTRYLGSDGGRSFLVIGLTFGAAAVGPIWAAIALAGIVLGATEGAVAAAVAAVVIEVSAIALGKQSLGLLFAGAGGKTLLDFAAVPDNMFALGWLGGHLGSVDPSDVNAIATAFSKLKSPVMLLLQPVAWAAGAGLAGYVRRLLAGKLGAVRAALAGAGAGVVVLAAGTVAAYASAGLTAPGGQIALAAGESAVLALAFAAIWESFFPMTPVVSPGKGTFNRPASVATEDADVDELLRLIANAEDKLTTEHTTNAVVMITDMKSFSKMTEEDGSILTAKAIQRHRDLLLPLIEAHGGHGKSTGGDGLIAAFGGPTDALVAASEMQRALTAYNESHPDERDMLVRMGIAQGEVVLDKGGRPFIGAALNMAARVMNLADGGQVFCTGYIASSATEAQLETATHGTFELKNIAKPIEVFEVLWHEHQEPFLPAAQQ